MRIGTGIDKIYFAHISFSFGILMQQKILPHLHHTRRINYGYDFQLLY